MSISASPAPDPDRWYAMQELRGPKVALVPLRLEHAAGYLAAARSDDGADEVFRWLGVRAPTSVDEAAGHVLLALSARSRGERFAYAQLDAASGGFIGTTSLYEVRSEVRALAIGHTWLGRSWWRTGHNADSKLLLLGHAFDLLGAARVVWHTDIRNERAQRAIERLGATREGVLRKHRIRTDGSWRDTVQYSMTDEDWPDAAATLRARPSHPRAR